MADHLLLTAGGDYGAAIERAKNTVSVHRQEAALLRSVGDTVAATHQERTAILIDHAKRVLIDRTESVGAYLSL